MKEITQDLHVTIRQHGAKLFMIDSGDKIKYVITNDNPYVHGKNQKPYRECAYQVKSPVKSRLILEGLEIAYIADNNINSIKAR